MINYFKYNIKLANFRRKLKEISFNGQCRVQLQDKTNY